MKTILGKKMGMTQIFDENGNVIVQNVPKNDVISYEVEFD